MKNVKDSILKDDIDQETKKYSNDLLKTNIEEIFRNLIKEEKKIIYLYLFAFLSIFILINFLFYLDYSKIMEVSTDDWYYFLIGINSVYLIIGSCLLKLLLKYMNNIKTRINILHQLQLKNEKDLLSAKVVEKIGEHLNHEIKPALISLKNLITEYHNILTYLKKFSKPGGVREIDKLFYGEEGKDPSKCLHCKIYNKKSKKCEFYSWYGKPIDELLKDYEKISKISLNQIYETLKITKNLKSLKNSKKDISVYEAIEQSIAIFNMIRKYKFNYEIDKKLKDCFLNGLPSEILSNIIMNHIKNSLEANATMIKISFKGYILKDDKRFIYFEILDNGSGIPEKILDKIYDLEFTTKNMSLLDEPNSGVGLYLIKQILQYYSGDEKVRYTSSEGTIFCIRIPVKNCNFDLKKTECQCCKEFEENEDDEENKKGE